MTRFKKALLIACLSVGSLAYAKFDVLTGYGSGFTAPNVNDKTRIPTPFFGDIVYDTSDSSFWGQSSSGWVSLGGATSIVPPGIISAFGGTTAPTGYLICDGSAVSRTTYANLFAVIGTNFGSGDGSTTFNLPDLRGRFLRGVDGSAGLDPDKATRTAMASGGLTGNNVGSVQADAFKSHTHTLTGQVGSSVSNNAPQIAGSANNLGSAQGTFNGISAAATGKRLISPRVDYADLTNNLASFS